MTENEFSNYRDSVRAQHTEAVFIPRQFISRDDWDRACGEEYIRLRGLFRESNPDIQAILQHDRVVLIGEPGMGKTALAHACMLHFADNSSFASFVSLSGYTGDLRQLFAGLDIAAADVEGRPLARAYVLDGLDEVAGELREQFLSELFAMLGLAPNATVVLTCRQAIYEGLRNQIPQTFHEFYPLGFKSDDVLAYAAKRGLDPRLLDSELHRADLWLEASIPFVLRTLVDVVLQQGKLEATRSENLALVTDGLLEKRSKLGVAKLRKALQLLGLAMELYSKNELTEADAVRLLSSQLIIPPDEAQQIVSDLALTVLLRLPHGIRFQVRSFGEYFAARQLEHAPVSQVLSYARFRKTYVLNPTWGNTISYLIEMHPRVRQFFVRNEPEWVLPSSVAALTPDQREYSARGILEKLAGQGRFLLNDHSINYNRLANLLTKTDSSWLKPQTLSKNTVTRSNALLLLGLLHDPEVLREALTIVHDQNSEIALRRVSFVVVSVCGSAELIPDILKSTSEKDPLFRMCLDAAVSLMTPATLPLVMPKLTRSTLQNLEIRSREMLVALLDYFLANPEPFHKHDMASYLSNVWPLLTQYHDDDILVRIGLLFANCGRHGIYEPALDPQPDLLNAVKGHDSGGIVSRTALEAILRDGLPFSFCMFTVSQLCTVTTAEWLLQQNPPPQLILDLASCASAAVREILRPATAGLIEAQDSLREQAQVQEAQRRTLDAATGKRSDTVIRESDDLTEVLGAFSESPHARWPQLDDARKVWLATRIEKLLVKADALHNVRWFSEWRVEYPGTLRTVEIVSHYGLMLVDDVVMVHSLLALEANLLTEYHRKRPLSFRAVNEFERILNDPALPTGAVSHFVSFTQNAKLESPKIYEGLHRIATAADAIETNRNWAAAALAQTQCPIDVLLSALHAAQGVRIKTVFVDALIDRQHLPTIFERLNRLPADDQDFKPMERPFPEITDLNWVGKIRAPEIWNMLANLRKRLLRLALPNLVGITESALAGIDKKRLIELLSEQLPDTPEAWREYTKTRIASYERERRFEQATAITFDEVLLRLGDFTNEYRVRLLCEGLTDERVFRFLLDSKSLNSVGIHSVGGWGSVRSSMFDIY